MATVQRYVDTASSGGDGTTDATSGANAAYASLSSWEANAGGSATDDYIVDCNGTAADTTAVTVDFTTNLTTGTVLIRGYRSGAAGFYTGGAVISTSHYRLDVGNVADALRFNELNCTVDGIQILTAHSGANGNGVRMSAAGCSARNCRIINSANCDHGIGSAGANIGTNSSTRNIENNLVVNFDVTGIDVRVANNVSPTCNVLHNTVYGDAGAIGIRLVKDLTGGSPTFNVKGNALANSGASTDIDASGVASGTVVYADNATEDFDLGTTNEIDLGATTDAWTSPGTSTSSDFTVKNTSSALYSAVNPTLLTTDITGFTRDGTNHDVGCFEFRAGGTTYDVDVSEAASSSDSMSSAQSLTATLSEAASSSDSTSCALTIAAELAEALSATDAFTAVVVLAALLTEGAAAAEDFSGTLVMAAALDEPATATDLVNWGGAVYAVAVDEAASATDSVTAAGILAAALSEIAAAADSFTAGLLAVGALSEPAAPADSVTGLLLLQAAITEAAAAADSVNSGNGVVYDVAIAEAAAAADDWTSTLTPAVRAAITAYRRTWLSASGVRPPQISTSRRRN